MLTVLYTENLEGLFPIKKRATPNIATNRHSCLPKRCQGDALKGLPKGAAQPFGWRCLGKPRREWRAGVCRTVLTEQTVGHFEGTRCWQIHITVLRA